MVQMPRWQFVLFCLGYGFACGTVAHFVIKWAGI